MQIYDSLVTSILERNKGRGYVPILTHKEGDLLHFASQKLVNKYSARPSMEKRAVLLQYWARD